jgi:hypothetical protein
MPAENLTSLGAFSALLTDIDDWCGTKPKRPFPPRPKAVRDLLISVAIHNLAAQISDARIRDTIQSQAASLHASAGKQIAG